MDDILTLEQALALVQHTLVAAGTTPANAAIVADALVAAEAEGLAGHGLSRVPFYAEQVKNGKLDGRATPEVQSDRPGAVRVDACNGFAFPAIRAGIEKGLTLIDEGSSVVGIAVTRSHHAGALGYHVEQVAARGYLGIGFANSPSAMAPWGGQRGTLGTNPIAFACPRQSAPPLVIDLSLSKVARGKVVVAAKSGAPIPEGWALDRDGGPTTDAAAALQGTMIPIGGAKGASLALMVEILSAALTGAHFAFQASSFLQPEGPPPGVGQFFLIISPDAFATGFTARLEVLLTEINNQPGTRLPGARRLARYATARQQGIDIAPALHRELLELAGQNARSGPH